MFTRLLTLSAASMIALASTANAGMITGTATDFTGSNASVDVILDDTIGGLGTVTVTLKVNQSVAQADLRGLWMHISDEELLETGSFSILSDDPTGVITQEVYGPANSVNNLGVGNNLNGGGGASPAPTDIAFEIGTSGVGSGDLFQVAEFVLTHSQLGGIDLSLFANQVFGVRLQSVGGPDGIGNGSSKMVGSFPPTDPIDQAPSVVPEPTTLAIWSAIGICGLATARRKRNKKA